MTAALNQREVARAYREALQMAGPINWRSINTAILGRWSMSGLERIKQAAWDGKWRGEALT